MPEATQRRQVSNSDGFRRDREALAGDWRKVGQDLRNAAEKIMSSDKAGMHVQGK